MRTISTFLSLLFLFFGYEMVGQKVYIDSPSGVIIGQKEGDIQVFKGIPFAKPPVGALRWMPPEPAEVRDSIFALDWSPICPQKVTTPGNPGNFTIEGEEDCLYLNIWAPTNLKKPAPVMLFIHGGGNQQGGASVESFGARIYDGQLMAERGSVVLVTIQYRIGALGFLVHPALEQINPRGTSGNYGLLDQMLAMKWVRENIGAFGGDKDNVTIFGESAGSIDIGCQLLSPLSSGLFDKAIMESGTPFIKPYELAKKAGMAFADSLGCRGMNSDKTLQCLRALSPEKLLTLEQSPLANNGKGGFIGPVADKEILPVSADHPFSQGVTNKVPLIIGSNSNEMGIAIPQTVTPQEVIDFFHAIAPSDMVEEGLGLYPPGNNGFSARKALVDATTDAFFTAPARRTARAVANAQDEPVWRYVFDKKLNGLGGVLGAFHALELFYVFNTLERSDYGTTGMDDKDRYVMQHMLSYWTSFAETGNPNRENHPAWPEYSPAKDPFLTITSPIKEAALYREKKCDYWDRLYDAVTTTFTLPNTDLSSKISLAPNPAKNFLRLRFGKELSGKITVWLVDAKGAVSLKKEYITNKHTGQIIINVEQLLPATYYIIVQDSKGHKLQTHFIKRN